MLPILLSSRLSFNAFSKSAFLISRSVGRCTALNTRQRLFSQFTPSLAKKYTQDHEWIEVSSDGSTATIGISKYAASALGDVVFVELPEADLEFKAGDAIGAVESVKSASDLMAPVSGKIVETNESVADKPGSLNKSPEDAAWIAKIKMDDASELNALMDAKAYKEFTEIAKS